MSTAGDRCPSCGAENQPLVLRCAHCGAFVRDRVPVVDLFSTLWRLVDAPDAAFLRVARSERKNYTHILFALTGPFLLAAVFVLAAAGDGDRGFGALFVALLSAGPVLGVLYGALLTLLARALLPALTYKQRAAQLAWALVPLAWAGVLVLPMQLGVLGLTMFSRNPAAWHTQPLPFWLLLGVDVACLVWSGALLARAFRPYGVAVRVRIAMPVLALLLLVLLGVAVWMAMTPWL